MADQQHTKIHPTGNRETPRPPNRTLMHKGSFRSEKGDPATLTQQYQRQHLGRLSTRFMHSNVQRGVPFVHSISTKRRNCCCKCLCWTIGVIILLLILVGAIAAILYLVLKPKVPSYSVDNLSISDLRLNFDLSLYAKFNVRIIADNPNKKIGIYYEKGSLLSVWYQSNNLCQGTLPTFYQGHQNRTLLNVALAGQSQYGTTLLSALQEEQQTGKIPLDLKFKVPIRIELGQLKLRKMWVSGSCVLIVDSLSTNSLISINTSTCKFKLKL